MKRIQIRGRGGWDLGSSSREDHDKWSNSGYIWETQPAGFDERLKIGFERNKAVDDGWVSSLSI